MVNAIRVLNFSFFVIFFVALTLKPTASSHSPSYHQKYEGYKIYDIHIENEQQYNLFKRNFQNAIDVISRAQRSQPIRVVVAPVRALEVQEYMRSNNLKFQLLNGNVSESIRAERLLQRSMRSAAAYDIINFQSYQRFDVISNYLEYLQKQYPQQVKIVEVGKSYEGRLLQALHITSSDSNGTSSGKPLILIDAGVHAREWISHATALYAIQQLVENSTFYQRELEMYDWLIWPVVNPDGYEYSHEHDRLWRKSRQPNSNGTSQCMGVDLNRNFDFYWAYVGSSYEPCATDYHGPTSFSEPEAVALRELLFKVNATCQMYLTLHSYGNYMLYPWGYDKSLPPSWRYLDAVARAGSRAIKKATGTSYTVGSSTNVLYAASGASDDYAFGVANIPVVLCMELPSGGNGFDPPADRILPIVAESWLGIRAMALEAYENPLRNVANFSVTNIFLNLVLMVVILILIQ